MTSPALATGQLLYLLLLTTYKHQPTVVNYEQLGSKHAQYWQSDQHPTDSIPSYLLTGQCNLSLQQTIVYTLPGVGSDQVS